VDTPEPKLTGVFHGRSWWFRSAVGVVVLLAGTLLINYTMYREWPWSEYPSTLKACGRDFQKSGPPQTRDQIEADHARLVRVGDMPGWFNRGDLWAVSGGRPFSGNCHLVMFVHDDGDEFQTYVLVGGP
jgi:hypothetical protein